MEIVSATPHKEKAAQKLVKCAIREWKRKKNGIAMDDMSAICLFFQSFPSQKTPAIKTVD